VRQLFVREAMPVEPAKILRFSWWTILRTSITLAMRLETCGYSKLIMATNGRQALEKMRAQPVDLVLLDIMMPDIDGHAVLQEMSTDFELRNIPVLMISAIEDIKSVVRCIELGATDYLTKPFNPVVLKARIDKCIEQARYRAQETAYHQNIEKERQRADQILSAVLPRSVARELKHQGRLPPRLYDDVSILFCDVVGFTAYSERSPLDAVFAELEALIERFEEIANRHGLEKIKTVGDAFMATAGLLSPHDSPVHAAVACGLEMMAAAQTFGTGLGVRIGVDHGSVVAGIMGKSQYDVWGDTVNTAARIERAARPGTVTVSGRTWLHLRHQARGRSLGLVDLKGKERIEIVECVALKAERISTRSRGDSDETTRSCS
jgi:adenylate cyclase